MLATTDRSVLRASTLAILIAVNAAACSPRLASGPGLDPGRSVLPAEEIDAGSARNAWELLERRFPELRFSGGAGGGEAGIRGRGSFTGPPVVVLDGVVTRGTDHLRNIPVREIRSVRVLSSIEASQAYGSFGANGAIMIVTRSV